MLHHMQLHQLPQNGHQNPYTNINSTATSQHDQVPILKRFFRALLICDHRKLSSFLPQGSKIESFSSNDMWCKLLLHSVCSIQGKENKKGRKMEILEIKQNDRKQEKSLYINMFQVVEDIDVVTLKKVEKLEWERKHG